MRAKGDLLLGNFALKEGYISKEQLYDCLIFQERNPSRTLGSIMVQYNYITEDELSILLTTQKDAFQKMTGGTHEDRGCPVLGKMIIENGIATEFQVNECLRIQGKLVAMGIKPEPLLGEILVKRGYVKREDIEKALQFQNLNMYLCPNCENEIAIEQMEGNRDEYRCNHCGDDVPFLFAQMAIGVRNAIKKSEKDAEEEIPEEVRSARSDARNIFGKYTLIKRVGKGGSGVVYKAWQNDLNKFVALKRLLHHSETGDGVETPFGDAEDVKRFYNEVHAVAKLSHPHIVPIYDVGWVEDNFFFTMKYIEGTTLSDFIHDGVDDEIFNTTIVGTPPDEFYEYHEDRKSRKTIGLPMRQAMEFVRDIAHGVSYAHSQGVFHRDIKPQNVLIDENGKVWIMDFGLAKEVKIADSAYVKGIIMGTPSYMPPEQAKGDMNKVDHLSDIYSIGAVLYECLCGSAPFYSDSNTEVLKRVLVGDFSPPSEIDAEVDPEAEAICLKAMDKNPKNRYQTVTELIEDIHCYLNDEPLKNIDKKSFWGTLFGAD